MKTWTAEEEGAVFLQSCSVTEVITHVYINNSSIRLHHNGTERSFGGVQCWTSGIFFIKKGDIIRIEYAKTTSAAISFDLFFIPTI